MKNQPMISVLMPVYNVEKYVRQAIESILSQTFTDFELIIVNDGSTDRTSEIIKSFQDDRIKVHNQINLGIGPTRNLLINLAKGKYLAWMDGDDISYPFRLEKQINFLEKHPDFIMVGSSAIIINENGKYKSLMFSLEKDEKIKWQILFNNSFVNSSVLFKREIVIKHNLKNSDLKTGSDYKFWSELIKYGKVKNIQTPLIAYRVHDKQITDRYKNNKKGGISAQNLRQFDSSITPIDARIIKNWYWGYNSEIGKNHLEIFKKLINVVINSKSENYFNFTKMFRSYYDKLIIKNIFLFNLNDIKSVLKYLIKIDKAGIYLMPFRFILMPLRIIWRIIRKIFSILNFFLLLLMNFKYLGTRYEF